MDTHEISYANCTNNGNISIIGNEIQCINVAGCSVNYAGQTDGGASYINNYVNNGIIKIANNKSNGNSSTINVSGLYLDSIKEYNSSGF